MATNQLPASKYMNEQVEASPYNQLTFEAVVVREAALACQQARMHNCTIEIHIGARWGKRPVDVTITPNEIG